MTESQAQKIVTMLVTAYPNMLAKLDHEQQADTRKIYREMILDIEVDVAAIAVRGLLATHKFLPTIAELREACVNAKHGRRRPGGDAWGDVVAAMKRYGYTRTPGVDFEFGDSIVAHVVDAFGWQELCRSTNTAPDCARFIELYDQLALGTRSDAQIAPGLVAKALPARPAARRLGPATFAELTEGVNYEPADEMTDGEP